ncbi:MAG TPA: 3-phosphoshikimate 1-carboxyvinyltransferase [Mycobacteriales bacterium]|nr:3-phosphoshikimate 1-carboxyvinyltransferase [Mycobacteriales bacterium]
MSGRIRVPGSKSQTNRAFILSALASGRSTVTGALVADDARHMVEGLRTMGVSVAPIGADGTAWQVDGCGGAFPDLGERTVDAGLSGTVLRFLAAAATLSPGTTTITGRPPLLVRPVGDLLDALRCIGARVAGAGPAGGNPPVTVRPGRPGGGAVSVDATRSSQFASALLLVAPLLADGLDLRVVGLGASGYVDLTVEMIRRRGAVVDTAGPRIRVAGGCDYAAVDEQVAGDASSASHLLALAAATGGSVCVPNLAGASLQPDLSVLDTFAGFGCAVERGADGGIQVTGPDRLTPVDVDLSAIPDQLPNVAVLAALAPGRSVIRGVGITRFHETDRISALERELAKVGVPMTSDGGDVVVNGGAARPGASLQTHDDHRLGMAFASLGLAVGDTVVDDAGCVAKTYPTFWSDVRRLGGKVSHLP